MFDRKWLSLFLDDEFSMSYEDFCKRLNAISLLNDYFHVTEVSKPLKLVCSVRVAIVTISPVSFLTISNSSISVCPMLPLTRLFFRI